MTHTHLQHTPPWPCQVDPAQEVEDEDAGRGEGELRAADEGWDGQLPDGHLVDDQHSGAAEAVCNYQRRGFAKVAASEQRRRGAWDRHHLQSFTREASRLKLLPWSGRYLNHPGESPEHTHGTHSPRGIDTAKRAHCESPLSWQRRFRRLFCLETRRRNCRRNAPISWNTHAGVSSCCAPPGAGSSRLGNGRGRPLACTGAGYVG